MISKPAGALSTVMGSGEADVGQAGDLMAGYGPESRGQRVPSSHSVTPALSWLGSQYTPLDMWPSQIVCNQER